MLGTLAAATGGRAFINDTRPDRIAQSIRDDLSCVYLVSFDAVESPPTARDPTGRATPSRRKSASAGCIKELGPIDGLPVEIEFGKGRFFLTIRFRIRRDFFYQVIDDFRFHNSCS